MKQIQLTQGFVTLVDDSDYEQLKKFKWHVYKNGDRYYATTNIKTDGIYSAVKMHRLILGLTDTKILIDHRNRDGLNNQRYNLRVATYSQNGANRAAKKNGASKYLGVYQCSKKTKSKNIYWVAHIRFNKKGYYLGVFKTEQEAALVYNDKAKEFHGEFANLNAI